MFVYTSVSNVAVPLQYINVCRMPNWRKSPVFGVTELNCSETYRFFQSQKLDMMANEQFLDGAGQDLVTEICPELLTMTVLRAPLARVKSNCCMRFVVDACKRRPLNKTALATADIWQVADNYMTRMLLGRNVYHSTFGSVTRHQLTQAKENLLEFDVVLTLERLMALKDPQPGIGTRHGQNVLGQT